MNNPLKVLVTGSSGFVGSSFCVALRSRGMDVLPVTRRRTQGYGPVVPDIGPDTEWTGILDGIDVVVHLAARAHIIDDAEPDPLSAFRHVNVSGTEHLAREAQRAGIRRFVYLSSIKVNGEETLKKPIDEADPPAPVDPYGISKWEAEQTLHKIAAETGLEVVVIRPPLVYGPGVKANFLQLLKAVDSGIPLPLTSVKNRRSLIALDNLIDFVIHCINHPRASGQTFLVSDGKDLSTPDLIRHIGNAMGKRPRLVPFPPRLLRLGATLLGQEARMAKLWTSLQVDSSKALRILGWNPVYSVDEGIAAVVQWYTQQYR